MKKFDICLVIPCYNEASFFLLEDYHSFLRSNKNTFICFVNDGSTDDTLTILKGIETKFPTTVSIVNMASNSGKAEAVRAGVNYCFANIDSKKIGFIDADLAVSLEESIEIAHKVNDKTLFTFGSRILRIGSEIERKTHRFLIGRFMATLISYVLDLKVYDTQCGCKTFDKSLTPILFDQPFTSKWLFDVELFFRMKKHFGDAHFRSILLEVPLKRWIDRGDSKVSFFYGFKVFIDLYQIKLRYK
jgi:glycosyltransferase involved in cell wall biosynthesis